MIRLSQSSYNLYMKCPRAFDYAYNRRLEKRVFNLNFFVGKIIHEGLHLLYKKEEDVFSIILKMYDVAIDEAMEKYLISPEMEKTLGEWKVIILGMLYAYAVKNGKFIDDHDHIHNEFELEVKINDELSFIMRIDNILRNKTNNKILIHEIKTTRDLTEGYVSAIKNSVQVACYYHLAKQAGMEVEGIVYDVLQKPSIRLNKNELYEQYLARLEAYYHREPDKHLWTEIIEEPAISRGKLINSIVDVAERIKEGRFKESFQTCGLCDFNKLCYSDDEPSFMMAYSKKEDSTSGTITGREIEA